MHKAFSGTCKEWFFRPGAAAMRPGVSIMVKFGQYLYSIFSIISFAQNWHTSFSSRMFSASMYDYKTSAIKLIQKLSLFLANLICPVWKNITTKRTAQN
jgi:hypothetical protein